MISAWIPPVESRSESQSERRTLRVEKKPCQPLSPRAEYIHQRLPVGAGRMDSRAYRGARL